MDPLLPFSIPVKGLHNGIHQFDFQIESSFFQQFEASPIREAQVQLTLLFDKRPGMFVLDFEFGGTVRAECDRCTAEIDLPIEDTQQVLVKFSETPMPEEADVVYVSAEITQFNVAQLIYEYICLSIPMIKVFDCESEQPLPCNQDMLRFIRGETTSPTPTKETLPDDNKAVWDILKQLDQDQP